MMAVHWGNYEATPPLVDRPLHEVSREEAAAAFDELMAIKGRRKDAILDLLAQNEVHFDGSDQALFGVGRWLAENVDSRPGAAAELADIWYVVAQDLGLLLGDTLIDRAGKDGLGWRLFTSGRRDVSYQRPVIMGFEKSQNPLFNFDPILLVANFAIRAIQGDDVDPELFARSLNHALGHA